MSTPIIDIKPLRIPWATQDPFIFCAYHNDAFPGGNDSLGPNTSLEGRNIGQDFDSIDGWNMYHGSNVPGFPAHPHSGFETVTIVTKGVVDHSDSLGGKGRFGNGDVQWLTSGKGVQHSEMFPLLNNDNNTFELFQLWINLPKKSKKVEPHYKMLWKEDIPVIIEKDNLGNETRIDLVAGTFKNQVAISPTPNSWAADPNNDVQIWRIKIDANGEFSIPATENDVTRSLYFYDGDTISVGDIKIDKVNLIELNPKEELKIKNGSKDAFLFYLQGRPMNEPIVQYGPFVTNSKAEIEETMDEYRRTKFGGWPWSTSEPVHDRSKGRFAKFADGTEVSK